MSFLFNIEAGFYPLFYFGLKNRIFFFKSVLFPSGEFKITYSSLIHGKLIFII